MRPELNRETDPEVFINFYWLKEELIAFCKYHSIPTGGKKQVLTQRIYSYLKTGVPPLHPKTSIKRTTKSNAPLSLSSRIPEGYKNDQRHREFFKAEIGDHFAFNVRFMDWMKNNPGKTYKAAVSEWKRIDQERRNGRRNPIAPQFEYNQYTRDFFRANPGASRVQAVKCWKYKKSLPGHKRYEQDDLIALND